jgi:hypothetical protein
MKSETVAWILLIIVCMFLSAIAIFTIFHTTRMAPLENLYINDTCVVVEKFGYNDECSLIIRRIKDTTDYTELNGYNWRNPNAEYGNLLFYCKNVGDTLSFKFINKRRFWRKR